MNAPEHAYAGGTMRAAITGARLMRPALPALARNPVARTAVLARGGSVAPSEAYRAFRGRGPEIAPLLARRGLR